MPPFLFVMSERSRVVITGFEAKFYDELLNILSFYQYPRFIKKVIFEETMVDEGNKIAELGVGNGRNAILFAKRTGNKGKVVGFDISDDMIEKAKKKTEKYPNIEIVKHSILKPYPEKYHNFFDIAFISFVFHGLEDYEKDKMLENLGRILKKGGRFYILDYAQTDINNTPFYYKFFIRKLECPLAEEFLSYNLEENLKRHGFVLTRKYFHFKKLLAYSEFTYSPDEA